MDDVLSKLSEKYDQKGILQLFWFIAFFEKKFFLSISRLMPK